MNQFKYLFSPIKVGTMTLKNRIVMPPMERNWANRDGSITDRYLAHYEECAKGGPGLIVVEATYIDPVGAGRTNQLGIWNDGLIPGLRELVNVVHKHDVPISIELHHAGRETEEWVTGRQPISASPVPCLVLGEELPREMTLEEIRDAVEKYGEAARRAKKAGFDAVEVHGAHGYLPAQFLSPWTNKRTDEYGGSLEHRMRFPLEIVAAIREKVGQDFTIGYRFSADEFVDGGLTLVETKPFAQKLEEAGVDYLHVSGGLYETGYTVSPPPAVPLGFFVHLASAIKQVVKSVPVIAVNRIKDPIQADKILADGHADLTSFGRAMLADPQLPNKAKAGRLDDIVACVSCNQGCNERLGYQLDVTCVVNPAVGREREFAITPSRQKKKIMVVGGGPAGMEAARVAAMRGHLVTLYEKEPELGGQVHMAALPPSRGELSDIIRNLLRQLGKLDVKIELGVEVTPELVKKKAPDAVVIATGAEPKKLRPLSVPGADRPFVLDVWDVLKHKAEVGQNVAVIGGDFIAAETAEYLVDQGKMVHLVVPSGRVADNMEGNSRAFFLKRLETYGNLKVHLNMTIREITDDGIVIVQTRKQYSEYRAYNGSEEEVRVGPVNTVVTADRKSAADLRRALKDTSVEIYEIGDAVEPRTTLEAIYEGSLVGRRL